MLATSSGAPLQKHHRTPAKQGTQSLDRALSMLMKMALVGRAGLRLKDLASSFDLDDSTTHRLLGSLIRHGFVEKDAAARRYHLGLQFFSVASAAAGNFDLEATARRAMHHIRERRHVDVSLWLACDLDIVCIDFASRLNKQKQRSGVIGRQNPIGSSVAGIAFLAALPQEEIEEMLIRNIRRFAQDPESTLREIRKSILFFQDNGYAFAPPVRGWLELALPLLRPDGHPEVVLNIHARTAFRTHTEIAALCRDLIAELAQAPPSPLSSQFLTIGKT